jgi:hypothetical protein
MIPLFPSKTVADVEDTTVVSYKTATILGPTFHDPRLADCWTTPGRLDNPSRADDPSRLTDARAPIACDAFINQLQQLRRWVLARPPYNLDKAFSWGIRTSGGILAPLDGYQSYRRQPVCHCYPAYDEALSFDGITLDFKVSTQQPVCL